MGYEIFRSNKYYWIDTFREGLAQVEINRKYGVINSQGKEILPLIFNNIEFVGSVIIVTLNRQYGVIDNNGEYILPCQYDRIDYINDGVIVARKSNTRYEFNQSGELVNIFCN